MHIECEPSHDQLTAFGEFIDDLMSCLDENRRPQNYIPEQRELIRLKNNLISNSFIIYGSTGSGKTSSVIWAASQQPEVVIQVINCDIDTTEQHFIQTLSDSVRKHSKLIKEDSNAKRNNLVFENMKFDELNQHIVSSQKKFVFVIKKCQQIAEMKKPTLFYNLLEWMNGPMKPYLGLVFLSRAFHFTDRLEKRVKSRLTAKSVTLIRPQGQKIIKIYLKRYEVLYNHYSSLLNQEKSKHRRRISFLQEKQMWLKKLINCIQTNRDFKQFVNQRGNAINNQFISCMKVTILKSLRFQHVNNFNQMDFNKAFVCMMKDSSLHIAPSYIRNLIMQCPLYSILVLSLIAHMGINQRSPYKMGTLFELYKQIVLNNPKFNNIKPMGSSRILFQRALQKLLDMRIIFLAGDQEKQRQSNLKNDNIMSRQLNLALPPQDLREIISEIKNVPQVIKQILEC